MQCVCVEATTIIACVISQAGLQQYRTWQTATHELYKTDVLCVLWRGPRVSSLPRAWFFPKFRTRRLSGCIGVSKVQHHSLHLSPPPAGRGNNSFSPWDRWRGPCQQKLCVWYGGRCSLSTCCCCCKNCCALLVCSIRKAFDQVNTSNVYFPKNKH